MALPATATPLRGRAPGTARIAGANARSGFELGVLEIIALPWAELFGWPYLALPASGDHAACPVAG
jgi:hypothetical protein